MSEIHLQTKPIPAQWEPISETRFCDRVARMGVVKPPTTTSAAMEGLLSQGICTQATRQWLDQKQKAGPVPDSLLAQVYELLEECPSPATEWQAVREVLNDDDLLAALLGIGPISVRRYAKGDRHCSDSVAARLHWLALLIDQLEGTYNAYGIRRWFKRPRVVLSCQTPQDRLKGDWDPDDDSVRPLMTLAHSASSGLIAT